MSVQSFPSSYGGHFATLSYKPRQARKGATVVRDARAEPWLLWLPSLACKRGNRGLPSTRKAMAA